MSPFWGLGTQVFIGGHWKLPDSLCFLDPLGHMDYVFGTCTFQTNFVTLNFLAESQNSLICCKLFLWKKDCEIPNYCHLRNSTVNTQTFSLYFFLILSFYVLCSFYVFSLYLANRFSNFNFLCSVFSFYFIIQEKETQEEILVSSAYK